MEWETSKKPNFHLLRWLTENRLFEYCSIFVFLLIFFLFNLISLSSFVYLCLFALTDQTNENILYANFLYKYIFDGRLQLKMLLTQMWRSMQIHFSYSILPEYIQNFILTHSTEHSSQIKLSFLHIEIIFEWPSFLIFGWLQMY